MIVVNYFRHEDGNEEMHVVAICNDALSVFNDMPLIHDAIDCYDETWIKNTCYEVILQRATISSDPVPEPAFCITHVNMMRELGAGQWSVPPISQ